MWRSFRPAHTQQWHTRALAFQVDFLDFNGGNKRDVPTTLFALMHRKCSVLWIATHHPTPFLKTAATATFASVSSMCELTETKPDPFADLSETGARILNFCIRVQICQLSIPCQHLHCHAVSTEYIRVPHCRWSALGY